MRLLQRGVVAALLLGCQSPPAAQDAAIVAPVDAGCGPGLTRCGPFCVDLSTDLNHCTACNNRCPNGPAGTPICDNGCGFECVQGRHDCREDVPGCEATFSSPATCGSCEHACAAGDSCAEPTCQGTRQVVTNGTFALTIDGWLTANNPVNAEDTVSTFRYNGDGDAENVPSTGACARVLYQDLLLPAGIVAATFTAEVRSFNSEPLNPDAVTTIETNPYDGVSDAFRIDLIDPNDDVFYAPILYTLFTTVDPVGTSGQGLIVEVTDPAVTELLQSLEGTAVRLRIAQVESNFPWHVDVDNLRLTVDIEY